MDTEHLYEFYTLAETLNFSKAATMLFISQGTLSRHMLQLEKELGVTLMIRSTHQVTLTEAGQYLANHIPPLLAKCNNAEHLLQVKNLSADGKIRIACEIEMANASHIIVFINRFLERYEDIDLTVDIIAGETPISLLQDYDIVITPCAYENIEANIARQLLYSHKIYLAMPPKHHLITKQGLSFSDLVGESIIVPYMHDLHGPYYKNYMLAEKYTHGRIHLVDAPNIHTALFWVSLQKGVCMIPRYAKKIAADEIFLSEMANPSCCFQEYVYFNTASKNEAAHLFFEELCTTFVHDRALTAPNM